VMRRIGVFMRRLLGDKFISGDELAGQQRNRARYTEAVVCWRSRARMRAAERKKGVELSISGRGRTRDRFLHLLPRVFALPSGVVRRRQTIASVQSTPLPSLP